MNIVAFSKMALRLHFPVQIFLHSARTQIFVQKIVFNKVSNHKVSEISAMYVYGGLFAM